MGNKELAKLLFDANEAIFDAEYNAWCNTTTCRDFKEWRSEYKKELCKQLRQAAEELDSNKEYG